MIDQQLINIKRVLKSVTEVLSKLYLCKRYFFENVFSVNYVTQNGGGV